MKLNNVSDKNIKFADGKITPEVAIALISEFPKQITLSTSKDPTIIYRNTDPLKLFDNIKFVLHKHKQSLDSPERPPYHSFNYPHAPPRAG